MSTTRCALLVLVAACSSKKPPPAPEAPCLPGEISSTAPGISSIDGVTARACWGTHCLTLDRDGRATGPADLAITESGRRAAAVALATEVTLRVVGEITACNNGGRGTCVVIHVPEAVTSGPHATAASPSLKRVSVFSPERVDVWDPKAGAVVATFPTTGEAKRAEAIGDTRVIYRGADEEPWTLLDLVGGASLVVGEPGWDLQVIDATTAAVFRGDKLIAIDAARMAASSAFTLPGRIAQATAWFDRIFVVLDHPAGTAQIDPKTGSFYAGPPLPICR